MENKNESARTQGTLKRKLGLGAALAVAVGTTVGSGIFSSLAEVAGAAGSGIMLIVCFIVGGIIMIPQNMLYAELASAYPEDGGQYTWLKEAGWRPIAFLNGWLAFWATRSLHMFSHVSCRLQIILAFLSRVWQESAFALYLLQLF